MKAVEFVENIRINPGNYASRPKRSPGEDYTDEEYREELEHVRGAFLPLVEKARKLGVSMRIGTTHGSLSDRIVSRRGNSPDGMVEAALEFARMAEDAGYHDILFSMKSSNVRVMIQAYRLLVERADSELRYAYPLHLGVTEAGDGDEGRIKSAMGIGALLEDGLGDTIRVSLTEDPVNEVPVGFAIVKKYNEFYLLKGERAHLPLKHLLEADWEGKNRGNDEGPPPFSPFSYARRLSSPVELAGIAVGGEAPPAVETALQRPLSDLEGAMAEVLQRLRPDLGEEAIRSEFVSVAVGSREDLHAFDALLVGLGDAAGRVNASTADTGLFVELLKREVAKVRLDIAEEEMLPKELVSSLARSGRPAVEFSFIHNSSGIAAPAGVLGMLANKARSLPADRLFLSVLSDTGLYATRKLVAECLRLGLRLPVIARFRTTEQDRLSVIIRSAIQAGTLFSDGIGDMISLESTLEPADEINLALNILQGARIRMSKTEFISCPGCGRTYFDLEKAAASIKGRMAHLKGLKIGIMGCVVNGPGEMADADFGYVGAGKNRISLYVGRECVEENLPEDEAVERLIGLIRKSGRWIDLKED